ncbi:hypothetical protein D3C73_1174620 [compost metagenome]
MGKIQLPRARQIAARYRLHDRRSPFGEGQEWRRRTSLSPAASPLGRSGAGIDDLVSGYPLPVLPVISASRHDAQFVQFPIIPARSHSRRCQGEAQHRKQTSAAPLPGSLIHAACPFRLATVRLTRQHK